MILIFLCVASTLLAPAGAVVCGRSLLQLSTLDAAHPIEPCVDASATAEAAVSGIGSSLATIDFPDGSHMLLSVATLISSFLMILVFLCFPTFAPASPPPRYLRLTLRL